MIPDKDAQRLGKMMARGALSEIGTLVLVWLLIVTAISWAISPGDDSESPTGKRSGLRPRTDHLTGCQYLETKDGGITPRVDRHGRQICK